LKQTLEKFRNEADIIDPKKPIYLSGFSLGANVVVKLLGELGEDALVRFLFLSKFTIIRFLLLKQP